MPEELYSQNSQNKKPENTRQEPIERPNQVKINSDIQIKKESFWKEMIRDIFPERTETMPLWKFLWKRIVAPSIRKLGYDAVENVNLSIFYPDGNANTANQRKFVEQSSISRSTTVNWRGDPYRNQANQYIDEIRKITTNSRAFLENIIDEANDYVRRYGFISIEDFNYILDDRMRIKIYHTDKNWGWRSLNYNCIVQTDYGEYFLDLPNPIVR